jgi:hypothetical protein
MGSGYFHSGVREDDMMNRSIEKKKKTSSVDLAIKRPDNSAGIDARGKC